MIKLRQITFILLLSTGLITIQSSCTKYDDGEVIENSYLGAVYVNEDSEHPEGEFIGVNDNGNFTFAWDNPKDRAQAKVQLNPAESGTVQLVLRDKKDEIVLQEVLLISEGYTNFDLKSKAGKSGIWEVSLIFTNFKGEGTYDIEPAS